MDLKPCTMLNWISTKEQLPPQGTPVWFWSNLWIDLDFNPEGIREGFYSEDGLYTSYGWDPCFDAYTTCEDVPKMWALRCPPGSEKETDPLLKEMAEALDKSLKALKSYGLSKHSSVNIGESVLQKYHEQEATNAE